MKRHTLSNLYDGAIRLGVALSIIAFAWSVNEIHKLRARPSPMIWRQITPSYPCDAAPDWTSRPGYASLEVGK